MAFVPYADPNQASGTVAPDQWQYSSIVPFTNDMSGINAAAGATPAYASAAANSAYQLGQDSTFGGFGSAQAQADAANTAAYYNDTANQLSGQLNNLDPQQAIGLQNIGNSYNLQANRLDQQKAASQRDYNLHTNQNNQGYSNNRSAIMQNTRAQANALQRLLGINGAGNSSAAFEQAPYAAGLLGTQQLTGAQQTYGQNAANLDTSWQDTQRGYSNAFDDLNNQRYQQENGLRSSIAQTRASLLDKIAGARTNAGLAGGQSYATAQAAQAGTRSQVDALLAQIAQLGQQYANPVLRAGDVSFKTPSLNDYILRSNPNAAAPTPDGGAASDLAPTFLGLLSGQQRDQFGNLITA